MKFQLYKMCKIYSWPYLSISVRLQAHTRRKRKKATQCEHWVAALKKLIPQNRAWSFWIFCHGKNIIPTIPVCNHLIELYHVWGFRPIIFKYRVILVFDFVKCLPMYRVGHIMGFDPFACEIVKLSCGHGNQQCGCCKWVKPQDPPCQIDSFKLIN